MRETGIAYDMFADPNKAAQKWQLDLMPIVFSSAEWRWLEAALVQRARLFDRLLADLYGPQELMRQGLVPPELVFSDNAYLRPCQGILDRAGPLRFYAADLARGADGKWRVIDNHIETLAGIGFVLANRVVHTHVTGDLFKRVNAVRLAAHFQRLQVALAAHAQRDNARIALLTPGPQHQDYFSHAYLARYLGLLLVEGSDLRTRGSHVYLKTLEGLKEIDLIVRCVDGRQIDPLELDPAGFKGPAGLLRVNRDQPQPRRQRDRLGGGAEPRPRPLSAAIWPSISSARNWRSAMRRAGGSAIRPRAATCSTTSTASSSARRRKARDARDRPRSARRPARFRRPSASGSRREIGLHGARLVAEEKIGFSTAPAFGPEGLEARPFAVRLYVAHTVNGFEAMPGGLAMTVDPVRAVALSASDGHTRDVWVLSDTQQAPHVSLWRPKLESARIERSQRVVQSRVADDLFWLGRYSERADWTMRVLRGALRRIAEDGGPADGLDAARRCLAMRLTDPDASPTVRGSVNPAPTSRACARASPRTLASSRTLERTLEGLYQVSYLVRDRLSLEAWQTLSRFRPGDPWMTQLASAAPGTSARSARRGAGRAVLVQRPDAREHDAQLRLVVPRHGPAARARLQPQRSHPDAVHPGARSRGRDQQRCCCCWNSPTASSPIARATASTRCWRWCSTCCCSTKPTRARSPTSSPPSRSISRPCPMRAKVSVLPRIGASSCRC